MSMDQSLDVIKQKLLSFHAMVKDNANDKMKVVNIIDFIKLDTIGKMCQ